MITSAVFDPILEVHLILNAEVPAWSECPGLKIVRIGDTVEVSDPHRIGIWTLMVSHSPSTGYAVRMGHDDRPGRTAYARTLDGTMALVWSFITAWAPTPTA